MSSTPLLPRYHDIDPSSLSLTEKNLLSGQEIPTNSPPQPAVVTSSRGQQSQARQAVRNAVLLILAFVAGWQTFKLINSPYHVMRISHYGPVSKVNDIALAHSAPTHVSSSFSSKDALYIEMLGSTGQLVVSRGVVEDAPISVEGMSNGSPGDPSVLLDSVREGQRIVVKSDAGNNRVNLVLPPTLTMLPALHLTGFSLDVAVDESATDVVFSSLTVSAVNHLSLPHNMSYGSLDIHGGSQSITGRFRIHRDLHLTTTSGSINVDIEVVDRFTESPAEHVFSDLSDGSAPLKPSVNIATETQSGSVSLRISAPSDISTQTSARSQSGSVKIFGPTYFEGGFALHSQSGAISIDVDQTAKDLKITRDVRTGSGRFVDGTVKVSKNCEGFEGCPFEDETSLARVSSLKAGTQSGSITVFL